MRIEVAHQLGEAKAIERIDGFLDELARRDFPGGAKVRNPSKTWNGNSLTLSFSLVKGFFETKMSGTLLVTDRLATLETEVPGLVAAFVGEDRIRTVLENELTRVLAGS